MIALIVAKSINNCIGNDGRIPWHVPEDISFFKKTTTGHTVIMGRKTWESLPKKYRPLPNRKNVIITRQKDYTAPEGVEILESPELIPQTHPNTKRFIIGGAKIYEDSLKFADTLYITEIPITIDKCDTFFPDIDLSTWQLTKTEKKNECTISTYKK